MQDTPESVKYTINKEKILRKILTKQGIPNSIVDGINPNFALQLYYTAAEAGLSITESRRRETTWYWKK
jgi:hypothetical protein